jgi:hypothetical protein
VRNNCYHLHFSCAATDFPQAEADLLAAAPTFTAEVDLWPPIPKGYETAADGIWLVAKAPSATAPLATLKKVLAEQEKRFRHEHGAIPKTDAPIVVLVHGANGEATKIEPRASEGNEGIYADWSHRRIFAVPVGKEETEKQGWLAAAAHGLLFVAKYGDARPHWVWLGERTVARAELWTEKPLPALFEGFANWIPSLKLHTLDEFEELQKADSKAWAIESFFYVAALRTGKHKKAYDAFLKEYAATGDGPGAFQRHLRPVGYDQLRDATNEFTTKIKTIKRKP